MSVVTAEYFSASPGISMPVLKESLVYCTAHFHRYAMLAFGVGTIVWLTLRSGIISKLEKSVSPFFHLLLIQKSTNKILCCCYSMFKIPDIRPSSHWYHGFISEGALANDGKIYIIFIKALIPVCLLVMTNVSILFFGFFWLIIVIYCSIFLFLFFINYCDILIYFFD